MITRGVANDSRSEGFRVNEPLSPPGGPRPANVPPAAAPPVEVRTGAADRRLLDACVAGDREARAAFAARFARLFHHVVDRAAAASGIDCPPAARPAVVDAMLEAVLEDDAAVLRGFAGRATPETYLVVAAHRLARRMLHRRPAATPRRPLDRDQLEPLLARLEPGAARLVRLHRLEGRSYGEISQLTGLPLAAIGPALARARTRMETDARNREGDGRPTGHGGGPTSTDGSARSIG